MLPRDAAVGMADVDGGAVGAMEGGGDVATDVAGDDAEEMGVEEAGDGSVAAPPHAVPVSIIARPQITAPVNNLALTTVTPLSSAATISR